MATPSTLPGITILKMTTEIHIAALERLTLQHHPGPGTESSESNPPSDQPVDAATGMLINTDFGKAVPFPDVPCCNRQLPGYVRDYIQTYGDNFPLVIQEGCREAYYGMARRKSELQKTLDVMVGLYEMEEQVRFADQVLQDGWGRGESSTSLFETGADSWKKRRRAGEALRKNYDALNHLSMAMEMIKWKFMQLGLDLLDERGAL